MKRNEFHGILERVQSIYQRGNKINSHTIHTHCCKYLSEVEENRKIMQLQPVDNKLSTTTERNS